MISANSLSLPEVSLRNTDTTDLDYLLAAEQSEENSPFIVPWTRDQHIRSFSDPNCAHLIVEAEKSVGFVILCGLCDRNKSIEFSRIVVTEKGHGFGIATILRVQKLAFETYGAHRLWLDVKVQNHRARSIYERAGFKFEGTLRECLRSGNDYDSLVVMSMLRQEYNLERVLS